MADATTVEIKTTGMHCQSCSMLIQMNVEDLPGIEAVAADAATGITKVTFDPDVVTRAQIADTIVAAGYGVEDEG